MHDWTIAILGALVAFTGIRYQLLLNKSVDTLMPRVWLNLRFSTQVLAIAMIAGIILVIEVPWFGVRVVIALTTAFVIDSIGERVRQ